MTISLAGAEEAVRLHKQLQRLRGLKGWLEKNLPGITQIEIPVSGLPPAVLNMPSAVLIAQVEADIALLAADLENIQ